MYPDDGRRMFLQNAGTFLAEGAASHPKKTVTSGVMFFHVMKCNILLAEAHNTDSVS
jgi:hypothetical protein